MSSPIDGESWTLRPEEDRDYTFTSELDWQGYESRAWMRFRQADCTAEMLECVFELCAFRLCGGADPSPAFYRSSMQCIAEFVAGTWTRQEAEGASDHIEIKPIQQSPQTTLFQALIYSKQNAFCSDHLYSTQDDAWSNALHWAQHLKITNMGFPSNSSETSLSLPLFNEYIFFHKSPISNNDRLAAYADKENHLNSSSQRQLSL